MQGGPHPAIVPDYFQHLRTLFMQAHALEIINVERLNAVPVPSMLTLPPHFRHRK